MEKIKALLQLPIKLWYKARDLVVKYPNVALLTLLGLLALTLSGR